MLKTKYFNLLAILTLIIGFAFHILYTNGTLILSNDDVAAESTYLTVTSVFLILFALFTCLAFLSKGRSVILSLILTILLTGGVIIAGYATMFIIGLSAI